MTPFVLLLLMLSQTSPSVAVTDTTRITESLIAKHTFYFDIRDNSFEGADSLLAAMERAHFVALGELHNRTRLGELTETLLHYLEPHGFNHFAVETGPYSARKLEELIKKGKPEVSAFYARYSNRLFYIFPIPFFKGESDLRFLSAADSLGYKLWGLDQEFQFSYPFLIDELARLAGASITAEQQNLQRKLNRRLYWMYRRNQIFSRYELNCRLQHDEQLLAYLKSFEQIFHPYIQQITDAFHTTMQIYCLNEQGEGNVSNQVRIRNFKANFDHNYAAALTANPTPKVFLKMGSFHMGRLRSPANQYDLGNHIHTLADSLAQSSVHIRYLNRFLEGKDMSGRSGWESFDQLISVGDREKWALIDLRTLREQLINGTLRGSSFEIQSILNYDFIIIPPEDDWVRRHW
ncbi:MAG: hypothetical protein LAT67_14465 [Balneolales bacterium]|nr:hypothetical protein [Balneolales bacterium]